MNKEVFALLSSIYSISDEYGYDLWDIDFKNCEMFRCVTYDRVDLLAIDVLDMRKIYVEFLEFHASM